MSTETEIRPLVGGVDFVFLPINDWQTTKDFYVGILGMELDKEYTRDGFGGEFKAGDFSLQVVDAAKIGRDVSPDGAGAIAFKVDDVAEARAELESKGVEFVGESFDSGVCWQAIFKDPDGHTLILHNRYAPKGVRPEGMD
jgi:catechol 2,3-dioxygenase-like lactoylglutathione lyase family enzyme